MLEKQITTDRIEVIESGVIQVRQSTRILEDGAVISESFHRYTIAPGDDYSQEPDRVKVICQAIHTQELIDEYKAKVEAQNDNL